MNQGVVGDPLVYYTQQWLNQTYGNDPRYEVIPENGQTGWTTIYALTRAFQIELGIQQTADNFGPTTISLFNSTYPTGIHQQDDNDESEDNVYAIIQGACFCKGYSTGVMGITRHFYNGTGSAIRELKQDAGLSDTTSTVTLNIMRALLSMDYFYSYDQSTHVQNIQAIQRYLNGNYEEYIGLQPCDGIYGRGTNEALIYAIQAEGGLPVWVANGNFGPTTQACCPTIPYTGVETDYYYDTFSSEQIAKFCKLINMGLYVNGFGNGTYGNTLDTNLLIAFQHKHALPETGICDISTWLALFVSCGNINRPASACDCATILTQEKAQTLYNAGYRRVGRYLSGTIVGGISKALTKNELHIIHDAGLFPFPIYQTSADEPEYFTLQNAEDDVEDAFECANALGFPSGTPIYFAVDCDPYDYEITDYIIPYFQKLYTIMNQTYNNKYPISIYGTRNVCTRVSNSGYALYSFVSDMSTGYSGNLGFKLPDNWAFDQFTNTTIGTGNGEIEIDRDAMSGLDLGLIGDLYLSDVGKVYYNLLDMYNLAYDYTNGDQEESNRLVLQYIRRGVYGNITFFNGSDSISSGIFSNVKWDIVAGEIDTIFCNLVDSKLYDLDFNFFDNQKNVQHDFPHLAATLNALLYQVGNSNMQSLDEIIDCYAGWAGDTLSFANDIQNAVNDGNTNANDYAVYANNNICVNVDCSFNPQDYIDDIDAYNLYCLIENDELTLPEAFYEYYISTLNSYSSPLYQHRAVNFLNNLTNSHFDTLCTLINSNEIPICDLKHSITNANQIYIDAAINAFKSYVLSEYILNH